MTVKADVFGQPCEDIDPVCLDVIWDLCLLLIIEVRRADQCTLADELYILDKDGVDTVLINEGIDCVEIGLERFNLQLELLWQELSL